jgi:Tol biopolymer transport system component
VDRDLVEQARRGDREAFAVLVHQVSDSLYAVAHRILRSWLELLDLATNRVTKLESTVAPSADSVPEQPAWSPDGRTIAFSRITWGTQNDAVLGTVHYGDHAAPVSGKLSLLDVATGGVSDVATPADIIAGEPNWSPDSQTIVFDSGPELTAGVSASYNVSTYAIGRDGTGLRKIAGLNSPQYLPNGQYILYKSDCNDTTPTGDGHCDGKDNFGVMRADFTDDRRVNINGMDMTDGPQGFSYVGHWIDNP